MLPRGPALQVDKIRIEVGRPGPAWHEFGFQVWLMKVYMNRNVEEEGREGSNISTLQNKRMRFDTHLARV
jgi:hypothetical protein